MCHPGRIGGSYRSVGPTPVWAKLFVGIVFTLTLIGFLVGGTVQHLVGRRSK